MIVITFVEKKKREVEQVGHEARPSGASAGKGLSVPETSGRLSSLSKRSFFGADPEEELRKKQKAKEASIKKEIGTGSEKKIPKFFFSR